MNIPKVIFRRVLGEGKILTLESITVDFGRESGALDELDKITPKHPASVLVIPFDLESGVWLIREFGAGTERSVLKFPTGRIESSEDARAAADRELAEEIGCRAKSLTYIGCLFDEPGHSNATTCIFFAEHLRSGSAVGDEPQQPEILKFPASNLLELIRSGRLMDSRSIAAVMQLIAHKGSPIAEDFLRVQR
ncbi:NUDIX domain-containing protein [Alloyangia pacifica]|uniref:NUDIX domain-containing protein n=1 Tax=Alloyangia pacifica TaxID=311180 RepID=UPI001CFEEA51